MLSSTRASCFRKKIFRRPLSGSVFWRSASDLESTMARTSPRKRLLARVNHLLASLNMSLCLPARRVFLAARVAFLAAFACFLVPALPQTAAQPPHDPRTSKIIQTLGQGRSIRETDLSPDGNYIAWNVSGSGGGIKVAPLNDPVHPRDITACTGGAKGRESGIAWSPDSKTLAFFSDCTPDHKTGIFTDGVITSAAPHQLSQLNGYAESLQYSPDGKFLTFFYVEGATRPSGALAAMKPPSGVIGVEGLEVQRVAAVDASTGNLTQITPANLHVYEFDWSPDSQKVAYVAVPPPGEDNWWTAKLYTQSLTGQPKVLFDPNTTAGPLHGLQL